MANYDPLRAKTRVAVFAAFGCFLGIALASGLGWTREGSPTPPPSISERPAVVESEVQPALDLSDAFTNLADAVTPSVVRIEAVRRVAVEPRSAFRQGPEGWPNPFGLPQDPRDQSPNAVSLSVGSGFVVSPDGYILTNTHVVEGAGYVTVQFADKRSLEAKVVGIDPFTDVALVKVEPESPLAALALGDSDETKVGEWVLAVGNPGVGSASRLDFTVTAGIVSARGRPLQLLQRDLRADPNVDENMSGWAIEDFLQTDAVINPGNSGGPMINLRGQAIGINTAILSTTGAFQGYGFAVPINIARNVMDDLVEYGSVRRPRIGVEIQTVTANDADAYDLPSVAGVLVQSVQSGGPAEGILQAEDVVVALQGEPVGYTGELQAAIARFGPGEEVTLTVYRRGSPLDVTVRLGDAPINSLPDVVAERETPSARNLGIDVTYVSDPEARQVRFESGGVFLRGVVRGSAAHRSGVGAFIGWKLSQVGDSDIASESDLRRALGDVTGGEVVTLRFQYTDGERRVVNVRMPRQ